MNNEGEVAIYLPKRFGLVLALLVASNNEPIEGRTRLVKMLLLLQERLKEHYKHELDNSYIFMPHLFGPFALDLFFDIELAKEMGIIEERKEIIKGVDKSKYRYSYKITPDGLKALNELLGEELEIITKIAEEIKKKWNDKPLKELLHYVYKKYPEYTVFSVLL